ncbi:hypothetical protein [Aestuariimicrobium ganziense]|uniref:hypothetical protein n=1 Tax=Aestuariimicrobium ganziense TaxID=2773677 RepID=UPI0019443983|nr:hypothetical protein [Aestuariimicrobium ganziense]
MVGTLVGLQLKLFGRDVRGNTGKIIALIFGGLYLAGATFAAIAGQWALRTSSVELRGAVLTVGFAMVTLLWPFLTLLVSGVDQTLDPGRFALFPVRARTLMPGLLLATFTTLGGFATGLIALGSLLTWSTSPLLFIAALVAAPIGAATCVLLSRALVAVFASAITTRKFRDLAAITLGLVGLGFGLGIQFVSRGFDSSGIGIVDQVSRIGRVLGWTPVGWIWSVPWEVGHANWLAALAKLVLGVALAAGAWLVWERSLDKALVSPLESSGEGTKVGAASWVDRIVPASPAGAVAARSLRYWRRDPRHLLLIVSIIALPFLMAAPMWINRDAMLADGADTWLGSSMLTFPVFGFLLMTGLTVAGEINYDGSALWTQISAGLRGRDDRWGRLLALGVLLVPIAVATIVFFLAIGDLWRYAPGLVGASVMAICAGGAVGSVAGALWQWPTPPPGQNAFAKSSGGGMLAMVSSLVCMIGSGIVAAPTLALALLSGDRPVLGWVALVLGLVAGPLLVWGGVVWGGRILDRTWPEVLKRVTFEKS